MKYIVPLLLLPALALLAATKEPSPPPKTPQEIQQELDKAQSDFERAQKMFDPWYTGPLITPSASLVPPAVINYQPYVFVQTNYQAFDQNRNAQPIPNLIQVNSLNVFQIGITNWVTALMVVQGVENWQNHSNGGSFGDLVLSLGFQLNKQTLYTPQVKFSIQETFPSGSYNHLSNDGLGLSGIGAGSYQTTISVTMAKLLMWDYAHPLNLRWYLGYTVPSTVPVADFNVYGGGYGTRGKVRPGNNFSTDFGIEYSINQPWVLALDLVYTYTNRATFNGYMGVNANGTPATVGRGSSDNLSLAPAIEYNFSENLGIITGAQFSVYGRNSANFAAGIFSVTWLFVPRNN